MDVLMPQLGETVAEGKITKWFKSAGEEVKPGDNLFEIETDKVSMEVPSTTTGVLAEIRVPAGAVAPVGAVVGVIADGTGATTSPASTAIGSKPLPQSADRSARRDTPGGATVTPLARRLAGEAGIDLSQLRGSGPHGRIVARDIHAVPLAAPMLAG